LKLFMPPYAIEDLPRIKGKTLLEKAQMQQRISLKEDPEDGQLFQGDQCQGPVQRHRIVRASNVARLGILVAIAHLLEMINVIDAYKRATARRTARTHEPDQEVPGVEEFKSPEEEPIVSRTEEDRSYVIDVAEKAI